MTRTRTTGSQAGSQETSMDDEALCEQCGSQPAATTVQRASGPLRLCDRCQQAAEQAPETPIAATWDVDRDQLLIEKAWPVAVNLHTFHLQRVLEAGIEVPARVKADDGDDEAPQGRNA